MDEVKLLPDDIYRNLVELLYGVYKRVNWKRITGRSISTDVFSHKLKVSGNMPTVERALEKLAYSLGVQSVFFDPEIISVLKANEVEVLRRIREETVYLTLLTYEVNKLNRGGKHDN